MQNNEIIKPAKYFSELEKSILLALVEKYKYVLECKKSDARTIALKQRTWQALAHEYNSQPSVSLRDFKQLKKCWENIKARTKKIMAHERREKVKRSVSPLLGAHILGKEKMASMLPEQLYFLQSPPEEEPEYRADAAAPGTGTPGPMHVPLGASFIGPWALGMHPSGTSFTCAPQGPPFPFHCLDPSFRGVSQKRSFHIRFGFPISKSQDYPGHSKPNST